MTESIIDAKGRITLSRAVREAISVQPGDGVRYLVHQDGQILMMAMGSTERLFGTLKYHGPTVTLEEMDRAIAEGAALYSSIP